jgi:hypothetical protein
MTNWTDDELTAIGEAEELLLASERPDGSLRKYIRIWVVRVDDGLYVRSAYGPDNAWFRRAKKSGIGRIRAGKVERDVSFAEATADPASIDAAYQAKYGHYPAKIVATVVGPDVEGLSIQLVPRPS